MDDKRFEKTYEQGVVNRVEIWVDRQTGVNYLWINQGNPGGLTPLLGRDGKPVITAISPTDRD